MFSVETTFSQSFVDTENLQQSNSVLLDDYLEDENKMTSETNLRRKIRIHELKNKINDDNYLNNAIDRIAVVISRRLVENRPRDF